MASASVTGSSLAEATSRKLCTALYDKSIMPGYGLLVALDTSVPTGMSISSEDFASKVSASVTSLKKQNMSRNQNMLHLYPFPLEYVMVLAMGFTPMGLSFLIPIILASISSSFV